MPRKRRESWAVSGNLDDFGDWLTERSAGDTSFTAMPPNLAPGSIASSTRLREVALDRGLASPILIAQGKSASVSVANIFTSGFALPTVVYSLLNLQVIEPWLRDYLRGGACYTTHLRPYPTNIERFAAAEASPIIVHVRDPRQQMVSLMEHYRLYPNQLGVAVKQGEDEDEVALDKIIGERLDGQVEWISGWVEARDKINVKFSTFEEFVEDRQGFLDRILGYYGGDTKYFDQASAWTQHARVDYHRRKGSVDEWRTRLSPKQIAKINEAIPNSFWELFGWRP